MPTLILAGALSGSVMRYTRSTMLEVLRQDYVRTARAKGLSERSVIFKHSLRNAVLPVITAIGLQTGILIGGTVVLETIFSLPGIGTYLFDAINGRDYPVVQAVHPARGCRRHLRQRHGRSLVCTDRPAD